MAELAQRLTYKGTPHQPDTPVVHISNLTVRYTSVGGYPSSAADVDVAALSQLTVQISEGEQLAIIGPNGAGKSTLLKVIAGLIRPDIGQVKLFGHAPDQHICIAYVPQRSEIDWSFPVTVRDVVLMGRTKQIGLFRRPQARDHAIVTESLGRVQAEHLANKQIGELSGGQQQRVFIARALAQETDLLLMDEPLSGLDIPSQNAIFDILDSLRPDGVTVMMATHDLNLAAERFDRIMLLNRQIIALGTPKQTLTTDHLLAAYGGYVDQPKQLVE